MIESLGFSLALFICMVLGACYVGVIKENVQDISTYIHLGFV